MTCKGLNVIYNQLLEILSNGQSGIVPIKNLSKVNFMLNEFQAGILAFML